jgi:1-acyl-sn-glycerol-3-phosphate acyltransferase
VRALLSDGLILFLRLVTRVFFRSVEVSGLENIPADGPVIFVGNHPNSLLDPVMVTTTCTRRVRFAAKDVLFAGPLRPFLWLLGSVPVRRRQDQVERASEDGAAAGAPARVDNSSAFQELFAILASSEAFGIFPEGISHTRPELAPLKTGAARIALGAATKGIPVRIVPVGLHYRRRDRMRSRVLVQYGAPLVVLAPGLASAGGDAALEAGESAATVRELTARIALALRAHTINVTDFDTLRVLDGARQLYRPEGVTLTLAQQAEIMRRFIDHWTRLQHLPAIRAFYDNVASYQASLRALGLADKDLRGDALSFLVRIEHIVKHIGFSFVLVPAAIVGIVVHLPVLGVAVWAGSTLTSRGDVRATIKMCTVTFLTLLGYALSTVVVWWRAPASDAVAAAAMTFGALVLSGYAAIRVLDKQSELRRSLKTFVALLHLDQEIARLAAERARLRARLLELIDTHLGAETLRIIDRSAHDDVKDWLDDDDAD